MHCSANIHRLFFYWLLCLLLLPGCLGVRYTRNLSKEIKTAFTHRLEGTSTGLDRKIALQGIYRYWLREYGSYQKVGDTKDTFFLDLVFYEDGTMAYNIWFNHGYQDYESFFKDVVQKGRDENFYKSHYWGIYQLVGDTIKAQYLMHASPLTPWYAGEQWFLIKGRHTLQVIASGELGKRNYEETVKNASAVQFIPLSVIPPPLAWFKQERFFWRNEEDWKKYTEIYGW